LQADHAGFNETGRVSDIALGLVVDVLGVRVHADCEAKVGVDVLLPRDARTFVEQAENGVALLGCYPGLGLTFLRGPRFPRRGLRHAELSPDRSPPALIQLSRASASIRTNRPTLTRIPGGSRRMES